jgi:hypothetical protein
MIELVFFNSFPLRGLRDSEPFDRGLPRTMLLDDQSPHLTSPRGRGIEMGIGLFPPILPLSRWPVGRKIGRAMAFPPLDRIAESNTVDVPTAGTLGA